MESSPVEVLPDPFSATQTFFVLLPPFFQLWVKKFPNSLFLWYAGMVGFGHQRPVVDKTKFQVLTLRVLPIAERLGEGVSYRVAGNGIGNCRHGHTPLY